MTSKWVWYESRSLQHLSDILKNPDVGWHPSGVPANVVGLIIIFNQAYRSLSYTICSRSFSINSHQFLFVSDHIATSAHRFSTRDNGMATKPDSESCHVCGEHVETYKCTKCDNVFCFPHLQGHREETRQELQDVQNNLNIMRERVNHLKNNLADHPSMEAINQWEQDSIVKIQRAAEDARRTLEERLKKHLRSMEDELDNLVRDVRQPSEKDRFDETHVNRWNDQLNQLKESIDHSPELIIKQSSRPLINLIHVNLPTSILRKWFIALRCCQMRGLFAKMETPRCKGFWSCG